LEERLKDSKIVKEIRGQGLLLGIELDPPRIPGANMAENLSAMVISTLLNKRNVLTSYYDLDTRVLRFEPPLISTEEQIDSTVESLAEVIGKGTAGLTMSFARRFVSRKLSPP
jgi:acetylornithine/succinyldiaminopimelate/putrescine aminotransferase